MQFNLQTMLFKPSTPPAALILDTLVKSVPGFCRAAALHASEDLNLADHFESVYIHTISFISILTLFLFRGGDIHVCLDGNFHHRHRRNAGSKPCTYIPDYFISKAKVDNVGRRIEAQRPKRPSKKSSTALDAAIDECERIYTAADGRKVKTNADIFDDTGVMALVCRHDLPLFFANIDTPGEQQKFAISLVEKLFKHLPSSTTVTILYDVGCV